MSPIVPSALSALPRLHEQGLLFGLLDITLYQPVEALLPLLGLSDLHPLVQPCPVHGAHPELHLGAMRMLHRASAACCFQN